MTGSINTEKTSIGAGDRSLFDVQKNTAQLLTPLGYRKITYKSSVSKVLLNKHCSYLGEELIDKISACKVADLNKLNQAPINAKLLEAIPHLALGVEAESWLSVVIPEGSSGLEIEHAQLLGKTADGVCSIVAENLGETTSKAGERVTAEFVSGRLTSAEDLITFVKETKSIHQPFYGDSGHLTPTEGGSLSQILRASRWHDPSKGEGGYGMLCRAGNSEEFAHFQFHATEAVPITACAAFLQTQENSAPQKHIIELSTQVCTFFFASDPGKALLEELEIEKCDSLQSHPVWQMIFLSAWLTASNLFIEIAQSLEKEDTGYSSGEPTPYSPITQFGGKAFLDVMPRFSPGDWLRSGIFTLEESAALLKSFKSESTYDTLTDAVVRLMKQATNKSYAANTTGEAIANAIRSGWKAQNGKDTVTVASAAEFYLRGELQPGKSKSRYTNETGSKYGETVNLQADSIGFAGTQFPPKFVKVTEEVQALSSPSDQVAMSCLFELRSDPPEEETLLHNLQTLMDDYVATQDASDEQLSRVAQDIFSSAQDKFAKLIHAKATTLKKPRLRTEKGRKVTLIPQELKSIF